MEAVSIFESVSPSPRSRETKGPQGERREESFQEAMETVNEGHSSIREDDRERSGKDELSAGTIPEEPPREERTHTQEKTSESGNRAEGSGNDANEAPEESSEGGVNPEALKQSDREHPTASGDSESAPAIPEEMESLMMPGLMDDLLRQLGAGINAPEQDGRIILTPPELGEIGIQFTMENGFPSVSVTASESLVRHILEQGIDQVKNLFKTPAVQVNPLIPVADSPPNPAGVDLPQNVMPAALPGAEGTRIDGPSEPARFETLPPPTQEEISRRHDIRDLHRHLLDQIRIKIDPSKNEARIQLRPPELGDIKIRMVMDDHRLTVRMEVSENMTRSLLERDLEQLKDALAEAGIEVGRFDIHGREEGLYRGRNGAPGNEGDASEDEDDPEGAEDEISGSNMISGSIRRLAVPVGVDYLVY